MLSMTFILFAVYATAYMNSLTSVSGIPFANGFSAGGIPSSVSNSNLFWVNDTDTCLLYDRISVTIPSTDNYYRLAMQILFELYSETFWNLELSYLRGPGNYSFELASGFYVVADGLEITVTESYFKTGYHQIDKRIILSGSH